VEVVLIHDGARPLTSHDLIDRVLAAARAHGGGVPGLTVTDLVWARSGLPESVRRIPATVRVQTPQAFQARPLWQAYRRAAEAGFEGTDTASCMQEFSSTPVVCVPGEASNLKLTVAGDLALAEDLLHI
jgi:2-C-methyl-D-erythritol 4-phosphate cytidylyltransferase